MATDQRIIRCFSEFTSLKIYLSKLALFERLRKLMRDLKHDFAFDLNN
ncbi:hypothetical protein ADICYQ_1760 [Cyclobacterium qasimii M12-11B]|uniref:Uncharacterized protein n=1 Tax=Cyclobacterium qasimii M12-11B TaxID=641524 RepID=S7VGD7_9BACT|nr:hypothetical protein ADICYQ_1760 [Cyclobacterium qasimii M12-11B]